MPLRIRRKAVLRIQIRSQAGTRPSAAVRGSPLFFGLIDARLMHDDTRRQHQLGLRICREHHKSGPRLISSEIRLPVAAWSCGTDEPFSAKGSISFEKRLSDAGVDDLTFPPFQMVERNTDEAGVSRQGRLTEKVRGPAL